MTQPGFKPGTVSLEVICSVQLSYWANIQRTDSKINFESCTNIRNNFQSFKYFLRRLRDSNPGTCYSQQFSRLPHSTALPNLRCEIIINKLLVVNTVKCVQEKLAMIFSTNLWTNIINRARTYC